MFRHGDGAIPAKVMLIGEAPGEREEASGRPFEGPSGELLNKLLHEAGIMRSDCYLTYLVRERPPYNDYTSFIAKAKKDVTEHHVMLHGKYVKSCVTQGLAELEREIAMVQPNIIVTFGNLPLWALTGAWNVVKWRGSELTHQGIKLLPTIHPQMIFRDWAFRALVVNDLRRVARHMNSKEYANASQWNFTVRPSYTAVHEQITDLVRMAELPDGVWLDLDIETRAGHIACIGVSWSRNDALCIPLMCVENPAGYWSLDEEAEIVFQLYRLFTHPGAKIRWQNGLYDAQYIHRHWHFIPNGKQDTMIAHHSCFAALPKGLSFLASMYCDHYVYWKDEGKTWTKNVGEDQLWTYNLQDCIYTREVGEVLARNIKDMGLEKVDATQQSLFYPVLRAMLRGVRVINENRAEMAMHIQEELSRRQAFLYNILGHEINTGSSKQMQELFYTDLQQRPIYKRTIVAGKTKVSPTCDDDALRQLADREPLLKPITNAIADIRTLGKFMNDFVMMPLDTDGRMRCSYNIAGDAGGKSAPYSYRLSSSKNAFGSGGNLQTIPSEKSKSSNKAAARGSMDFTLPNIRRMYGPDPGFTFFDMDLDRADLQVVVWESDDPMLKAALRMGADIHLLNTYGIDNVEPPPLEELVERHGKHEVCTCGPRCYWDYRTPRSGKREFAKTFCHGTNYLGKAKTMAAHTGRTVHEIDQAQKRWFQAHPGILTWHQRVIEQVTKRRFVENKFGYRWYVFDRIDEQLFPAAVAWIPQSTVGIVINKAWLNFSANIPEVQVLLQVHDSLAGQFPTFMRDTILPKMAEQSQILIPYADPLIIPTGIKTSTVSWGDCE